MRTIKTWLTTIAALLCSLTASAHKFEVDGIFYNITSSTNFTVEVTYKGSSYSEYSNEYSGTVIIPSMVTYNGNTYSVTSIGSWAFSGCSSLATITLPESVTIIGSLAFEDCCSLTSIAIPKSVTTIDGWVFEGCNNLSNVTIPEGVKTIGEGTFKECKNLTSITIPGTVTSIGNNVFEECTSLKDVIFEDGSTTLSVGYQNYNGEGMFYKCPIETVYLGRNIVCTKKSYAYGPFYENETLKSLVIGDVVSSIEKFMFYCNYNLSYIDLGKGLKSIGQDAFYSCNISSLEIPNSVTIIDEYAFGCCKNLSSVVIGNGVNSIGKGVFSSCSNLVDLTIGYGVSSIGNYAFSECNSIEHIYALNSKTITCDESIFSTDTYNNAILYVPMDRVFAYEKATPWSKFQIKPMKTFAITYMVDGKVYVTKEVEYGVDITLMDPPVKEGYTFTGWSEAPETMPAEDIVINGSFIANKYLVTFKIGDEVIASDSLEYGTSIVIPEAPEKEGYTFNGWGEDETVPAGDVTYEGDYSVNSYKLTFIVDGEVVQESSVDYGTTITLPEKPTKEGYSFDGWNEIPETMPASDVTVSGTFTVNKYLVTFRINNEVIASDSLEYGASIVTPEAPEKEGYTFDGWANVPETVPACNLTFEGGYTANEYLLAFIVDGALYEMRKVRCDEKITALDMAEREGCTFVWGNWIDKMPAKDYTVRGKYVPNKYAITYVADGEIVVTDSIAYGTAIEALKEPVKEGYTFSGWSEVPETMPAEDVVISGSFTVNTYKVYYYVGDVLVHTAEVAYGESIPEYVYEPTAEGDEFMGWVGETYETMPAHDVTYTANITNDISQCTISNSQLTIYDLNGRKIKADDLRELEKGIYIVNGKKVMIK